MTSLQKQYYQAALTKNYEFLRSSSSLIGEEKIIECVRSKLLLEHIVVQKMKDEFKKSELDELLRHGTKQLFREDAYQDGDYKPLRYEPEEIEKLDRSNINDTGEMTDTTVVGSSLLSVGADDKYFCGFKVACMWVMSIEASGELDAEKPRDNDGGESLSAISADMF